jgi:hypothetical protein
LLVGPGQLTRRGPTPAQWKDIAFGWQMAKEMGRLDIGQTVAVKDQAVPAEQPLRISGGGITGIALLALAGLSPPASAGLSADLGRRAWQWPALPFSLSYPETGIEDVRLLLSLCGHRENPDTTTDCPAV